MSRMQRSGLSL